MKLEVLLSTMNQENFKIIDKMNINNDCIIINQCNRNEYQDIILENKNVKFICSKDRGLSKSRNLAIKNSNADICLLADDDLEYVDGYDQIILKAFEKNPQYDIIAFQVEGKNKSFKRYSNNEKKLGYITSLKVSSVEIAFRVKSIKEKGIKFNDLLGAGAKYYMGEENEFLYKALRNKLKIKYIPIKIADLYIGDSSWFEGYNEKYFYNKGAAFTAMSYKYSIFLIIQFALRRRSLYKNEISVLKAINLMLKGRLGYKKEKEIFGI
ncbi:glycosyltransferase [Clostridium baratii]